MSTKKQMTRIRSTAQYGRDCDTRKTFYKERNRGWFLFKHGKLRKLFKDNSAGKKVVRVYQLNGFHFTLDRRVYKRHMRKIEKSEKTPIINHLKFGYTDWKPELIKITDPYTNLKVLPRSIKEHI